MASGCRKENDNPCFQRGAHIIRFGSWHDRWCMWDSYAAGTNPRNDGNDSGEMRCRDRGLRHGTRRMIVAFENAPQLHSIKWNNSPVCLISLFTRDATSKFNVYFSLFDCRTEFTKSPICNFYSTHTHIHTYKHSRSYGAHMATGHFQVYWHRKIICQSWQNM